MLPSYHIRPSHGWLNDPNGMTFHECRWHVFFQHNPEAPVHNRIQWGHVSSEDLATWTEHPVAFGPLAGGPDEFGCWSGVFASGLDRPAVVYSGVSDSSGQSTVCLRWGSSDLLTWSEPIVVAQTPTDAGVAIMRDPFLFLWEGRRWALLGAGLSDGRPAALVFSCDDFMAWQFEGLLATSTDPVMDSLPPAQIWECPQVVEIDGTVVLVLSCWFEEQLREVVWVRGALVDGGEHPSFVGEQWGLLDEGPSFYAPQAVSTDDGPLLFGWIKAHERHDQSVPVAGCLTLPRRLSLHEGEVRSAVDAGAQAVLTRGREPQQVVSGRHTLPSAGVVTGATGMLHVPGPHPHALPLDDATLWVDADVAEVYSPVGPPVTLRGGSPWELTLDAPAMLVDMASITPPA